MEKILGKKGKMTQVWEKDIIFPVTSVLIDESCKEKAFSSFSEGDLISVTGVSKGNGFQGVVKRHGFHGGPKTHGQKDRLRAPGSIGATAPQRVIKGKKMPGHMGVNRTTVKNLKVIKKISESGEFLILGALPGMRGSRIEIKK